MGIEAMIVTLFGNLEYGDEDALIEFIGNHNQAHTDLAQYLATQGIPLQAPDLSGAPTLQWFMDHALMHQSLDRALTVNGHPGLEGAGDKPWGNPEFFYDWHRINNDAHIAYSQKTGVT
jgi:hypothetical protein